MPGDLWRPRKERRDPPDEGVALRLAVSRKGLGLELGRPFALGAGLRVDELDVSLPHLKFPVDLSGGVPRFRHCRGRLERLVLGVDREHLVTWATRALVGLLGEGKPALSVVPVAGGVSLGVAVEGKALAWELLWAPLGQDLCVIAHEARVIGVDLPALALALQATERLIGGLARRTGALFRVESAARLLLQEVLPRAGARLPSTGGAVWCKVEAGAEGLRLLAEQGGVAAQISADAVAALEVAELLQDADEALVTGDRDDARDGYLSALEQAPRQREIALRLADLDRAEGHRAEAALSTLVTAIPAVDGGALGGLLLSQVGDREGARVAYERAADREVHPSMSALCLVEAAARCDSPGEQAALLGAAVIRAPSLREARWRRLEALLLLGDARGALAEAEHIEATTRAVGARVDALLRAARMMLARGMAGEAMGLFERALRARPSSDEGLVGLAEAMFRVGDSARAADALARAVALAEAQGRPDFRATVLLATVLAEGLGQLPLAIARARSVPAGCPEALPARAVEARALAQLGDRSGASLAYASLREGIEHGRAADPAEAALWLAEAARFEEDERADTAAAKRHLGVALRLRPRDPALLASFRRVAEAHERELEALRSHRSVVATPLVAPAPDPRPTPAREPAPAHEPAPVREPAPRPPVLALDHEHDEPLDHGPDPRAPVDPRDLDLAPGDPHEHAVAPAAAPVTSGTSLQRAGGFDLDLGDESEVSPRAADEARAENLAERVRADPTNLEVVLELAGLLESLGRDMDLFALLSARLEEGDDETRMLLLPLQRAVLRRLVETARRDGREMEASLYEQMLQMYDPS